MNTGLRIGVLGSILMTLAISAAVLYSYQATLRAQNKNKTVQSVISQLNKLNSLAYYYLLDHEAESKQQFLAAQNKVLQLLLSEKFDDPKQQDLLNVIRKNIASVREWFLIMSSNYEIQKDARTTPAFRETEQWLVGQFLLKDRYLIADGLKLQSLVGEELIAVQRTMSSIVFFLLMIFIIPLILALIKNIEVQTSSKEELQKSITIQKKAIDIEKNKRFIQIGTLATIVANELRNPLAAISMASYNIKRKANNPALEKHLITIKQKVMEGERIIDSLLLFSRLKPPHFEAIDLLFLLEECLTQAQEKNKKKASLIKNISALENIPIAADAGQMKEVFNNILNNAYEALLPQIGKIKITAQVDDAWINVSIEDNGPGIDEGLLDKVFEPFFTTKSKGTGLGLAVCNQIMTMHQGEIKIQPGSKQGTCVCIALPRERAYNGH
ncbi:MAG: hypothetical protein HQL13_07005 [Candidatus Omnitrophica bacterium]|nr:hypothetical protein [Candidatus Omnitrophota bacterium]